MKPRLTRNNGNARSRRGPTLENRVPDALDIDLNEIRRAEEEEAMYLTDIPVIPQSSRVPPSVTAWTNSQNWRGGDQSESNLQDSSSQAGSSQFEVNPPNAEDVFRIMIATDIHLGFMERDPIRGEDSFRSFEEILQRAKAERVDFLLLGGDLFHHSKPSQSAMFKTLELLRKYCLGDEAVQIELLSDQTVNFPTNRAVNYEDPNFNIALPIFSIHGNHDDPSGEDSLACIDVLSVANLVNHFGRSTSADRVEVYPVLLGKGNSRLALYGIGHIRDQRLHRVFVQGNVHFHRPCEQTDEWFNLFLLHQNRVAHSAKNCIHDQFIPRWMDLVFWGHEHECLISPTKSAVQDFSIIQPGSSIATSLIFGESRLKHIGILEVCSKSFKLTPIPLSTVRPFLYQTLTLSDFQDELDPHDADQIANFLTTRVNEMLTNAEEDESSASSSTKPMLPLVRLCVNYSGFQTVHPARFGQRFVGKVANPDSILRFTRQSVKGQAGPTLDLEREQEILRDFASHSGAHSADQQDEQAVGNLIKNFLSAGMRPLQALSADELTTALTDFVEKGDNSSFSAFINHSVRSTCDYLSNLDPMSTITEGDITSLIIERTQQLSLQDPDSDSDSCCRSPPQSPIHYSNFDDDDYNDNVNASASHLDVSLPSTSHHHLHNHHHPSTIQSISSSSSSSSSSTSSSSAKQEMITSRTKKPLAPSSSSSNMRASPSVTQQQPTPRKTIQRGKRATPTLDIFSSSSISSGDEQGLSKRPRKQTTPDNDTPVISLDSDDEHSPKRTQHSLDNHLQQQQQPSSSSSNNNSSSSSNSSVSTQPGLSASKARNWGIRLSKPTN